MQIDVIGKQSTGKTIDLQACRSQVASVEGQLVTGGRMMARSCLCVCRWAQEAAANVEHLLSRCQCQLIPDAAQEADVRGMSL